MLIFSIASMFRKQPSYTDSANKRNIAILIPAYKEDNIILETVTNTILHDYPKENFDIIVVADQLKKDTLADLSALPIKLIEVAFDKSTKARSIQYVLQCLPDDYYDILLILDADNIMGEGCLKKINHAFEKDWKMIQLHRTAKNKNTSTAILDAISEEVNNKIFRRGHRALGLSSILIGSGMAFDYALFKSIMLAPDIENNPAEDREIYIRLLNRGIICEYIENAFVYDEKVQSNHVMERQRIRWISAQLQYAKMFWIKEPLKTLSYSKDYLDFAIQTLLLPRAILLAFTLIMACLSLLLYGAIGVPFFKDVLPWIGLFLGCISIFIICVGSYLSAGEVAQAIIHFPVTFWSFFKAFLKSSPNQQEFIHTPKEFKKNNTL